ncbi:acetoacetate--CoA ligase [Tepidimonas aquatica]|uniref:Acetyl-coenzyme A synthetase n=1 Tax=Tepidimonas aquatica TaxID=247482 RepID=A0A554WF74_9BURK|nr:acetoacetate--CoA ligase [Tepidimonas aquatica]TSE22243.1 Acetyl-coenzyme A synthetase [Tepidimonas aquatica]
MNAHSPVPLFEPQIRRYQRWLRAHRGLTFDDYDALWRWSVSDLEGFWHSVWDYFELSSPTPIEAVLQGGPMPHVRWFVGAQLNYAAQVWRHVEPAEAAGMPAIIAEDELGRVRTLGWRELQRQVAALAVGLRALGVQRGDRVAAYLPNRPEAVVALLASASLGAIWSLCAPDMGTAAVLDRFRQIEPKVLIAADGVHYGGRPLDRSATVRELRVGLPTLQHVITLRTPYAAERLADTHDFAALADRDDAAVRAFAPEPVPFDHPLWIVYSSGTTGLPKPIVHGHGGIVLTGLALKVLHNDIGPSYDANSWGERFHWYSSTGWVMWNAQVAGLLGGTTIVLYDGSPSGRKDEPDWSVLWRFAARHRVTFFGAGAALYTHMMKAGVDLAALQAQGHDLSHVRALGSTGSPLPPEVQRWGSAQFERVYALAGHPVQDGALPGGPSGPVWWCNISGGTDFCGAFIGGHRELPQIPGQMQCRQLGCAVEAWDEHGRPLVGQVGELVCTRPIPSMPLYLWNDPGHARYLSSYFDTYPGVWRHGDWLEVRPDGGCVIYGRSDATLNRHGLRMGTSELYAAVEALPEVLDSLVVDVEYLGRASFMPLFVVLRPGLALDDALRERIRAAIRARLSPRFVPDVIEQAPDIPRTLSGKKQELPIKKLLLGHPPERVINPDAMANPQCLAWYVDYAQRHLPANDTAASAAVSTHAQAPTAH